jgi:hypothetical protein|tara:strand:- start:1037 stop:1420 length:384 start_codon:yes stop_codon:yes gene_type:complete
MASDDDTVELGVFLKQKFGNMARWVTGEVGKENLPVDLEHLINDRSVVEVTFLATVLDANSDKVAHRDWSGLVRMMQAEDLPVDFVTVVQAVRSRPELHDKFWRYLELFRDSVQYSNSATNGGGKQP